MTNADIARIARRIERLRHDARGRDPTPALVRRFRALVRDHYRSFGRDLPWRHTDDPYRVLVSEVMLQQTQVARVCEKYPEFLRAFGDVRALARAPVARLLRVWQGMGYNRRALALRETARLVVERHGGRFPDELAELTSLPGIGPATAADLLAFAHNRPVVVIETNIRAVFIHLFFPGRRAVEDRQIVPLVARTLDRRNPREWYNALMDLGVLIKRLHGNPARRSGAYRRQSPFAGSNRELRSMILKQLLRRGRLGVRQIASALGAERAAVENNLAHMVAEGFLASSGEAYAIRGGRCG
jgi:A/G-specific adenine glycosylase